MARISTYTTDADVVGSDKVLGTDAAGNATKNYRLESIGTYLTKSGRVVVSRQVGFTWVASLSNGRPNGSASLASGGIINLADLTEVYFSKNTTDGRQWDELLAYMDSKKGFIASAEDPNTFASYNILSVADHQTDPDIAIATVEFIEGQGAFSADGVYVLSIADTSDKFYQHTQSTPASTWNITHNLEKYPSVTIVNSAEEQVVGEVVYTDNNTLQLRFTGAFSGKAYLN